VSINTVTKLLVDVGAACEKYQDRTLVNLKCRRIQCDEIWAFVYAKARNPESMAGAFGVGDVWTWTAIDADTKLVPSWAVGRRDGFTALAFIRDLATRLSTRVQLSTDGHKPYSAESRYSPAECRGTREVKITGNPDPAHISTSYAERQNLSMRMHMGRFTRLTNGFSKKVENHKASVALYFMFYKEIAGLAE
jgi:IS1 family transposase